MLWSSQKNVTFAFLPTIQQVALWPPGIKPRSFFFQWSQLKLVLDHARLKNSQIQLEFQSPKLKVSPDPGFVSVLSARACLSLWQILPFPLILACLYTTGSQRVTWPGVRESETQQWALFHQVMSWVKFWLQEKVGFHLQHDCLLLCHRGNSVNINGLVSVSQWISQIKYYTS